jgi:uncharacterized sporulation protein YeaH/YhbH (DUF444 family)
MSKKRKTPIADTKSDFVLFNPSGSPHPFTGLAGSVLMDTVVNPPDYGGGDRTREDRERHKDRIRDQIKPQLPGIIGGNPIFGDKGKIKVPVQGGYEPRFRYGRDQGGGGGKGKKPGADPGDLIYVEITMEELIQMLFEEMELPDMLKKQFATTKVTTFKYRGTQPNGPKPRWKKTETARARIRRAIGMKNAEPEKYADEDEKIPSIKKVPFHKKDFKYHRVEEREDDDSKCVVFFVLDRSGSMGGDPLAIAKAYFLLNLLFLRTKYKEVVVVMVAHDAQAYHIEDERKFYQIEVDGGTMFGPAYELCYQLRMSRYSDNEYNAYMFHATDGYMFDGQDVVRKWFIDLITKAQFNYLGYLEIDPSGSRSWSSGGDALLKLPPEVKEHVGMAKVKDLKGIPDAFKQILTKDKKKGAK